MMGLLVGLVFLSACASPFRKKDDSKIPRRYLAMTLGMSSTAMKSEVLAMGESKRLWVVERPNMDVKRLEGHMGPDGEYLMKVVAHFFPLENVPIEDFFENHLKFLKEPKRKFTGKSENSDVQWTCWVWEDRKTSWELCRTHYPNNPALSEFRVTLRDLAFEDVLLNTGVGEKRRNQRDMLRTGDF